MQLGFALSLFFVAVVAEVLRQGGLGVSPLASLTAVAAVMAVAGLALLGPDVRGLVRQGNGRQYGVDGLGWSWRQTGVLLILVPFLLLSPVAFAASFTDFVVVRQDVSTLAAALGVQIFVIALAQELFFRESILKIFGSQLILAFGVSSGAALLFHLVHGLPTAVVAASASAAYLALRVSGMNMFVVAVVHGSTTVLFGRVLVAQIDASSVWPYAAAFAAGHLAFAGVLCAMRRAPRILAGLDPTA